MTHVTGESNNTNVVVILREFPYSLFGVVI